MTAETDTQAVLRERLAEALGPWLPLKDREAALDAAAGVFRRETVQLRTEVGNAARSRDHWHRQGLEAIDARKAAEAERDRLREVVVEHERVRAAVTEGAPLGRALTVPEVLEQHEVTRKALADVLGPQLYHLNWAQLLEAARRTRQANVEWQQQVDELQADRDRLAAVREYVATSDDDGVRTRQTVLGIVGELPDSAFG